MEATSMLMDTNNTLSVILMEFGYLAYPALFLIIFAGTGIIIIPLFAGNTLLVILGALAGQKILDIWLLYPILISAAILGNYSGYWLGHLLGPRLFRNKNSVIFKKSYLDKTIAFYAKHGAKTIVLARFINIVRSLAPFVAGVSNLNYKKFQLYNILGAFIWISGLLFTGYLFGNLPFVRNNFDLWIFGFIISVIIITMIISAIQKNAFSKKPHS